MMPLLSIFTDEEGTPANAHPTARQTFVGLQQAFPTPEQLEMCLQELRHRMSLAITPQLGDLRFRVLHKSQYSGRIKKAL